MPLVRLEVENFKSYRGKQIIGPFYSFSAIIGPNGSGKSNLMDAISFVLGVKSAQLRSNQLRDLIYRGRKVGGSSGQDGEEEQESDLSDVDGEQAEGVESGKRASVVAVFRDGKGIEHKFQRTVNLTGSSEYRLNGRPMPYAQYNARLEQHNILVKAKNFLVFQGDVEAVASQTSRDLSLLVDRISGSADLKEEYNQAKNMMDKAVESSTFNYNKRRGINSELKQFKEQKSEAERYEKLLDEKDAHTLRLLLWRLFHIKQSLDTQRETIEETTEQLEDLKAKQEEEEETVADARKGVAKVQKDMLKQEKVLKEAERELSDKQPELDAIETRISYSTRTKENAESLAKRVEADLLKHEAAVEKLQRDRERAQLAADEAAEERRVAAEQAGLTLREAELAEYQELKAVAEARAASEHQELESMKRDIRAKLETVANLEDKLSQLKARQERLTEEESQHQVRHEIATSRIDTIEKNLRGIRADAAGMQEQRESIRQREVEVNKTLQECYQKLLQAGHQQKESEKEAKLRETIMTLQKIFPGVRGRLVDLCEPVQRKYDTAVSIVLGRHSDSIVVEYERTAIDCIEYMRTQRVGQATFLPLDTIQVKPINDRLRSIAKGARLAFDVVKFQPAVQRAVQHACANALICDGMSIARHICYERKQEVKAVTLDGTVIHKSGLITGGQSGQGTTKRWEDRELQVLHRQREECISELKDLQKRKRELGSDDELIVKIGQLEAELSAIRDEQRSASGKLEGIRAELKTVQQQIKEIEPKLASERKAAGKAESKAGGLRRIVESAEDEVFGAFCARIGVTNIREYEERQLKLIEEQNEAKLQFEAQLKRLSHQLNFEEQTLTSIKDRMNALNKVMTREDRKIADAQGEKARLEGEMAQFRSNMSEATTTLQQLQKTFDDAKDVYSTAKRQLHQATKALDAATKRISSCNDTIEKLGAQRAEIYRRCRLEEIDLPVVKGSLSNVPLIEASNADTDAMDVDEEGEQVAQVKDYGIKVSFDDLEDEETEDSSSTMEQTLQERIDSVAADIERMTPNMKANERLDDTETRLQETEKEFDRSRREAKEARDEFIRIKKLRCELFNKAYNHISERIDQVYKDLTKGRAAPMGGIAYLSLEDTEEPYLSGIKYHAMPPMKRFRDMDQLSGGEKTMAALALLFAIHSYQPAPFFVLDEVDAALDSQNIAKVSNYIRQHASDAFQFIVISLKASLYERSQALVGIYRDQEVNSSATLTLDLEKYS